MQVAVHSYVCGLRKPFLCVAVQGVAYVLVVGRALWAAFYSTHFREPWAEGGERQLSAELASREVIAKLPHAGMSVHTEVCFLYAGKAVAVFQV